MEQLARQYHDFQNAVGQGASLADITATALRLFSPTFEKIANGTVLVANRDALAQQMCDVRGFAGSWRVIDKPTIASTCGTQCVLRFVLETEKAGAFEVMAHLLSRDGVHIDRIDEIYYQMPDQA